MANLNRKTARATSTPAPRARCRGAAALEFALVANIMFVSIFGCIEFARFVMVQGLAEDAAYEAARHVIVPGASIDEATAVVNRLLSAMHVAADSVLVRPYEGTTLQTEVTEDTTVVGVTVTIPVSNICLFTPRFILGNRSIVTTCTLFTERYHGYYDGSGGT